MLRLLLTALALVFSVCIYAQTDSTTIKLNQYKSWYELGVIDSQEYAHKKNELLNIKTEQPQVSIVQKTQLSDSAIMQLKTKGKGFVIAGSVITGFGLASVAGLAAYSTTAVSEKSTVIIGITTGCVATVVGLVLVGIGSHKLVVYKQNKNQLSLNYSPHGVGLCYAF